MPRRSSSLSGSFAAFRRTRSACSHWSIMSPIALVSLGPLRPSKRNSGGAFAHSSSPAGAVALSVLAAATAGRLELGGSQAQDLGQVGLRIADSEGRGVRALRQDADDVAPAVGELLLHAIGLDVVHAARRSPRRVLLESLAVAEVAHPVEEEEDVG